MDIHVVIAVAVRAVVVYAFLFMTVRLLGRRKLGIHSALDLVVAVVLADLAAQAIFGTVALLHGLLAVAVVAMAHYGGYYLGHRAPRVQRWLSPEPLVLVRDGELLPQALDEEHLTDAEFWSLLRQQGVDSINEVKLAILEPTGRISIVRQEWARDVRKGDLDAVADRG